jgi:hypothetical protein
MTEALLTTQPRDAQVPVNSLPLAPPGDGSPLVEHLGLRLSDLALAISERIRRRPAIALAAAIGVGFAIGGALTFRAGRIAIAAAARRVARELLKQVI